MEDVWRTYNPETDGDFKSWVELNKPSEVSDDDGVAWISVRSPSADQDGRTGDQRLFDLLRLIQSWELLNSTSELITVQSIIDLAQKYNKLTGKWMCFPRSGNVVNCLWEKIATAVASASLPPSIAAKVSPTDPDKPNHVLLVYNSDFTNVDEVYDLEKALRKLGIKCKLMYKPDVYTTLGVYSRNEWGLCPVLYESVYNVMTKESTIIKKY